MPGLAGYYRLIGQQVPLHVDKAIRTFPYHSRVFIAPPWRLVELPRTDPAGRAEFVLRHLAER